MFFFFQNFPFLRQYLVSFVLCPNSILHTNAKQVLGYVVYSLKIYSMHKAVSYEAVLRHGDALS